jgi:hypothetical protein
MGDGDNMDINKYSTLNEIYEPLNKKAKKFYKEITSRGYKASFGWYNMHSVKCNGDYITEFFPIPIITIESIGDIGLDLDSTSIEVTIVKEKALKIDYNALIEKYSIEVYGADDFLSDFYNKSMSVSEIKMRIQNSNETQIHIAAEFDIETELDKLFEFVSIFEAMLEQ